MKKSNIYKVMASSVLAATIFAGATISPLGDEFSKVEASQVVSQGENIMGASEATAHQLSSFVRLKNPTNINLSGVTIEELAKIFIEEGAKEGVRGDVAFAQSIKETGYFSFKGSSVSPSQHNFAGIGATGGGVAGNQFESPRIGVRAQIQHLKAYASTEPLNLANVDPRFKYVTRGIAKTYPELHGRWAMQNGGNYGKEILVLHKNILSMAKAPTTASTTTPAKPTTPTVTSTAAKTMAVTANLNLRATAGTSGKYVLTLPKNAVVSSTKTTKVGSTTWHYVDYKGKKGWVSGSYLKEQKKATSSTTVTPATNKLKTTANLNVRSTAGTSGKLVSSFAKGTQITSSKTTKVGSTTWHYVSGKNSAGKTITGWVSGSYLKK